MVKRLILVLMALLLPCAAFSGGFSGKIGGKFGVTAAVGGGAPATGDIMNEGFEGTGTPSGWTDVGTADYDAAVPGSPPVSLGSQSLRANGTGDTNKIGYWDWPGGAYTDTTWYHRFYLYVASSTLIENDDVRVYAIYESAPETAFSMGVNVFKTATDLVIRATGATNTTDTVISTGVWYRCELKWSVTADQSEFKLDGTSIATFSKSGNNWQGYVTAGYLPNTAGVTGNADIYIDGIGIDSTGWLGP